MSIGRIVKSELKKAFPNTKFSVTSDYLSVKVTWTNGPSQKKVEEITTKYQAGKFDMMTDCYEYNNVKNDLPQVKYVFLNRELSDDLLQTKFDEYKKYYLSWEKLTGLDDSSVHMKGYSPRGFIRHELYEVCL